MKQTLRNLWMISLGVIAGVLLATQWPVNAEQRRPLLPIQELRTLSEVFHAIKIGYVEPVEDKALITNAIVGMLSNLDPHSAYLDADAFKELQVGTQGEFGGLGIEVTMEDGFVKVVSPLEDTPAYRAGLRAGDFVVKLDDTPVKGLTLSDAVKRMRGKPNTRIELTIVRKGEDKPIVVSIVREIIHVQSVKSKIAEPGFAYLRITQFQENTIVDTVRHFNKLAGQGALKGLVLDLRNDPGGLLTSAVGVSAAFLPAGTAIVSTDGRTEDAQQKFTAEANDYTRPGQADPLARLNALARDIPMVVLINGGSASAAEIVAGALQDHKRAVIMGTQSFGKGSVQTILPLPSNAAIKLTTARYYTPSGRSIQAKGITPDIVVEESANGSNGRHRMREADLDRHLENDRESGAQKKPATPEPSAKSGPDKDGKEKASDDDKLPARLRYGTERDYQLTQAINLLKGLQIVQKR